jgi:hypothetical protein
MVPQHWATHDDVVCPGKRVGSWINVCSFCRVNQKEEMSVADPCREFFISEVFRFEELAFELITPGFYRVFFRDMEIGELNVEGLRFRAARRVV